MRILMINVVCGTGSTGRICTDLADEMVKQGHDVKIAYGRGNVPEKYEKYAIRIGNDADVVFHAAKARLFDASGFASKIVTRRFITWVNEYNPDIIHLHNLHGYYINLEILFEYLRTCEKKIIWTLHDEWAFTGHAASCDVFEKCEKWVTGCRNCPCIYDYPKSYMDRSASNWNNKRAIFSNIPGMSLVVPSRWLGSLVKQSFLSKYPVDVIRNGVDTAVFHYTESDFRERHNLQDKFIILGVTSVWNDSKGFSDFINMTEMLDESYAVVMVGIKPKQKQLLPKEVIAIERTNSTYELAEIYSAADMFVNLTYADNCPMVNMEAMSCGTMTLTYKSGGSPESVEEWGGITIEKGDLKAAVNSIEQYSKGTINRKTTKQIDFGTGLMIEKYYSIYCGRPLE